MNTVGSHEQGPVINEPIHKGPWEHDYLKTISVSIPERLLKNVSNQDSDDMDGGLTSQCTEVAAPADENQCTDSTDERGTDSSAAPAPIHQSTNSATESQDTETTDTAEMSEVIDVSERTVKDGRGKVGIYTGKCRIQHSTLSGQRVHVLVGQGQMKYRDGSLFEGEWKDGLWHGDGRLDSGPEDETYNGEWIQGKRSGLGRTTDSEGHEYAGDWKDDCRDGDGCFTH